jgi:hypothetical protein
LLSCLRSYVFTGDEKGLNADLQDYFFSAVASMDALDLAAERDAIRRNWCRPWDLATEQSNRALAQLTHERTALPLRATDGTPGASTITRQVFDQWWFLVYESDHAVACFEQMRAAWDGAIELHKNSGGLLRAMP